MSKKILKLVNMLLIMLLLFSLSMPIYATSSKGAQSPGDLIANVEAEIDTGGSAASGVKSAAGSIIGIIQLVGTAVAIFMLIYIGIKYVVASPDAKADIKHTALIYVIAAIFIFAASNILAIIGDWSTDIFGGTSSGS